MGRFFTQRFLIVVLVIGIKPFWITAQTKTTNIINYDFNAGTDYATLTPMLSAGITCSASSTESFITYTGTSSGPGAFGLNSTGGNALGMANSSGVNTRYFQFQLGGTSLDNYFSYKVYCQAQSSATGAATITLGYSTDNIVYSNLPTTQVSGNGSFLEAYFDLSIISGLNNQSNLYFRLLVSGASGTGTFRIDNFQVQAQTTPKYYRTQNSGNWNTTATWESSADNITWAAAKVIPTAEDKTVSVGSSHIISVSNSVSLDETVISGTLQIQNGGVLKLNDGAGNDIDIAGTGVLQILTNASYNSTIVPTLFPTINIASGGKIQIGDGVVSVGTNYETFVVSTANVWNDGSIFEWNSTTDFVFNSLTFFPNAGSTEKPRFVVSKLMNPIGGSITSTVNGLFVVNTNVTITGSGPKNFRNGFSGNGTLTVDNSTGPFNIVDVNSEISGTLTLVLDKVVNIKIGTTIPSGSVVTVSSASSKGFDRQAGDFIIASNAKLDMGTTATITNAGAGNLVINGTFSTANPGGFAGTGSTVPNNSNIILGAGSTIEYNANGDQDVQGIIVPQYYNVTFSGSGAKTLISNNNPLGTITVSGSVIFDAKNFTFGGVGTNLTMTGTSRYINSGGTTKPDAQGTYTLGDNTTIEFTGAAGAVIRLGISPLYYANIVVSGSNVSNNSTLTGIKFKPGGLGTFTVKSTGTFKLDNTAGFTGSSATAIDNTNAPTVILEDGSTVEYSGASQTITTQTGLPYYNLAFSGSGNKIASTGVLTVNGNLTNSGTSTFLHNGGTVLLNGAGNQNFAGLTYNNLILSNSTKITSGTSTIIDSIKVNSGATLSISSSDTIILHSDANRTARLGQLNGTASINYNGTGKFLVERFISQKRAWRFLSVAVNSTQSIKLQWQEGAAAINIDPKPGYGTQITDNNSATFFANGFDTYSAGGPSMKYYDPTTNSYIGISSTLTPLDPTLGGYMTFIRGDRSATAFGSPVTSTTLRSSGQLYTGNQGSFTALTNQFTAVNNPYASPIDLRKIFMSPTVFYYIWDPNRLGIPYGLGAFQTLVWNGSGYNVIPGTGSYGAINNFIESGQAFFTGTLGPPFTMQLTENAKADTTFMIAPFTPVGSPDPGIRTNLYTVNADGSTLLADGTLINFSDDYDNAVDGMDAHKLTNFGENIAIQSNNQSLVVERKKTIHTNDTLLYKIWGLRALPYRFELIADQMDKAGLDAYLEDNYLHTRTLLDLNGTTTVDFTVDNNAASTASDRFQVVFEAAAGPLPVTLTNVKAYQKNENITVEWSVENEAGIKNYEIEKSASGLSFTSAAIVTPHNTPVSSYTWLDTKPVTGNNYYRIKSTDLNGKIQYSKIVQVTVAERKPAITIYPNPVKNGVIHLQLVNQPEGVYLLRLINKPGQVLVSRKVNHSYNAGIERIDINVNASHGIYNLEIIKPDNSKVIEKIVY